MRSAYESVAYFPSIQGWAPIRWYFLPPDAPFVPGDLLYTSANWDQSRDLWPHYGEAGWLNTVWVNGSPPPWPPRKVCTLDLTADGVAVHTGPAARICTLDLISDAGRTVKRVLAAESVMSLAADGDRRLASAVSGDALLALAADGLRSLAGHASGANTLDLVADASRTLHANPAGQSTLALTADAARTMAAHQAGLSTLSMVGDAARTMAAHETGEATLKLDAEGTAAHGTNYDRGFDFRLSSLLITDPANCQQVIPTQLYPTTANNATFGWSAALQTGVTRSTTADPRLCGMTRNSPSVTAVFRVDLPMTGNYDITLAWGDIGSGPSNVTIAFLDNAATLAAYGPQNLTTDHFRDANNTDWSRANWPGSNTKLTVNMTSTIFKVQLAGMPTTNLSPIAHLRITKVP